MRSPWEELNAIRAREKRRKLRLISIVGFLLFVLASLIPVVSIFWPEALHFGFMNLTAEEPDRPARGRQTFAAGQQEAETLLTAPRSSAEAGRYFSTQFGGDHLIRLENNLRQSQLPSLRSMAARASQGPRKITYEVSGSGRAHEYALGRAAYAATRVIGAAGEWQVRPWWKPGWLPASVDCGEIGVAAIAGHVSWAGRPGPFNDLGAMAAGDEIRCQAATGSWFTYQVTEVVRIDYSETDYYWRALERGTAELSLFTCTPEITGIIVVRAHLNEEEN